MDYLKNKFSTTGIKVLRNFSWLFSDKIIRSVAGAIIGIFVARILKPDLFGVYSYVLVFGSFFNIFAGLGLHKIVVRNLSKVKDRDNEVINIAFTLMLLSGVLSLIICPILLYILRPEDSLTFGLVLIYSTSFIFYALKVIAYYYESETKMKPVVITGNIAFFIGILLKVIGLFSSHAIYWFVIGTTVDAILTSALLLFVYPKTLEKLKINVDFKKYKSLLIDSLPLIFTAVSVKIYADIDQIMIRELISDEETGFYAAAVKIANLWLFVPSAIFVSIFPTIVKIKDTNYEKYKRMLQRLYNIASFISYSAAIFFTFFAYYLITYTFGADYTSSIIYLKMLAWSGLFSALGGARTLYLISENLTRIYFISTFTACVINVILNFILIPMYGALGACIATLISYFIAGVGTSFIFAKTRNTGIMQLRSLIYPVFWKH